MRESELPQPSLASANAQPFQLPRILDPADPLANARRFMAERYTLSGAALLYHHRGEFHRWDGPAYRQITESQLRAQLYSLFEGSVVQKGPGATRPFKPTARKVSETIDALRAAAHLSGRIEPPAWLGGATDLEPTQLLPCALDVPPGELAQGGVGFFADRYAYRTSVEWALCPLPAEN